MLAFEPIDVESYYLFKFVFRRKKGFLGKQWKISTILFNFSPNLSVSLLVVVTVTYSLFQTNYKCNWNDKQIFVQISTFSALFNFCSVWFNAFLAVVASSLFPEQVFNIPGFYSHGSVPLWILFLREVTFNDVTK